MSLLEEITRTFLRWTNGRSAAPEETVFRPAGQRQVGAYRILERLGFGGMGHVYLALDTRLDRRVALKFLPPDLASDQALLQRLELEARTASALNHPNILTIYEIGEFAGERFIASEHIDGVTLRTALEQRAVDTGTAIDIASQVASALMAAHSAGIVHRDLKPGNIMIRPDGYVKVIDFGIAKHRTRSGGKHANLDLTTPGAIVGTLAYMSPEQARGEEVDARTDLWSLGVILFEMLARARPFDAPTETALIEAIQNDPIPPLPAAKSRAAAVDRILQSALAKNPARRYQTAGEMLADLQQLSQASGLSSRIRPVVVRRNPSAKWLSAAALLIILIAATALWWWPLGGKQRLLGPHLFQVESVRQVTFNGRTTLAALSPDGNYLAFVTGAPGGQQALYCKQVDSSTDEMKIPPRKISYEGLAFAPDSKSIFETEKDETFTGRLYTVPILGAPAAHPILEDIDGPVTFSPSGDRFAFVRYAGRQGQIFLASPEGGHPQKLVSISNLTLSHRLAWSPDGRRIAAFLYRYSPSQGGQEILDLIDLTGRESRRVVSGWHAIGQFCWTPDARSLILSCTTRGEGRYQAQLRQLDLKTGRAFDILKDLAGYSSASLTRDGAQLAAVKQETKASLWISNLSDFTTGQSASAEAEGRPSLAWAGDRVLMNSARTGFPNLWLFEPASQARAALTNESHIEQDAATVPNSASVVFSSNRDGYFHLWRFDPPANRYTQLTFGPNYDDTPAISSDGQWIFYTSWTSNTPHLRRVRMTGGASEQIGNGQAEDPQISPDGQWIACRFEDPATSKWAVGLIALEKTAAPRAIPGAELPIRWSPSGNELTGVRTDPDGASNVWSIPLNGSPPRQLTRFDAETILAFSWSPGGRRLACLRATVGGDVALFKTQKNR